MRALDQDHHRRQINLIRAKNFLPFENKVCDQYVSKMEECHHKFVCLRNDQDKTIVIKTALESSRYSKSGQRRIKRKIHKRLGGYPAEGGVLLTLTFVGMDTTRKGVIGTSRPGAWMNYGYKTRDFMDRLNKSRKAHGLFKIKRYIRVMEDQKGRGYPCPHFWFPGLLWLFYLKDIKRLWPYGDVDVKKMTGVTPSNYICKYITKMEGKDFMWAMMRHFRLRLFSTSRDFKNEPEEKVDTQWRFTSSGHYSVIEAVDSLISEGYSVISSPLILDRGG